MASRGLKRRLELEAEYWRQGAGSARDSEERPLPGLLSAARARGLLPTLSGPVPTRAETGVSGY